MDLIITIISGIFQPKSSRKIAGLEMQRDRLDILTEYQNHADFDGFDDITLINWKQMECADDSKAVVCDKRPLDLYGKTIWKPCLFGYICIKKSDC
ncbi:hypothetical protein LOAG_04298 [Loa loa]|uniref:Uncharacterized protein n=1 Tax=Loa loa TaxID=7209 RepID=A0A1S0U2G1_LOALO|nr:hypothetical protein LOAG_04298 [Loa loa]EFO24190.1 hypothetical protein LOAG_04298 [Loa loa]